MKNSNELIEQIGNWCNTYRIEDKTILTNSLKQGDIIQQNLLKQNYNFINLYIKKIEDIAYDSILHLLTKENINLITEVKGQEIVKKALIKLKESNSLDYFKETEITNELALMFYKLLIELKMEKVNLININSSNTKKLKDIQIILKEYERELKLSKNIDKADMFKLALETIEQNKYKYCFNLYIEEATTVEKEFISKYFVNITTIEDKEYQLEDIENQNNSLECFIGYGEFNELYEVIRKIKKIKMKNSDVRYEDIAIYYTDKEKYTQRMFEISNLLDIPVEFSEGVSIYNTKEANIIFKIAEWVESDYKDSIFYELTKKLYIEELYSFKIKECLIDLNIGQSKERYKVKIKDEIDKLTKKVVELEEANEEENIEKIKKLNDKVNNLINLEKVFCSLISHISENTSTYREVIKGIELILENYKPKKGINYNKAIFEILDELKCIEEELGVKEILYNIINILKDKYISLNTKDDDKGQIYFTSYKNGLYHNKKYNFIVGLDINKFPGKIKENPILLDEERDEINKSNIENNSKLKLEQDKPKNNINTMLKLIATRSSDTVVSYSGYNMTKNEPVTSSYLFLQLARVIYCDQSLTYDDLNGIKKIKMCGYIGNDISESIIESESFLYKYLEDKSTFKENKNSTSEIGKISCINMDLLNEENVVFSATGLKDYFTCPYKYLYKQYLKIKNKDIRKIKNNEWINKMEYGTIIHKIFEDFYNTVINDETYLYRDKDNNKLSEDSCRELINEVVECQLKKYVTKYGKFNEHIYNEFVYDIKKMCEEFLIKELSNKNEVIKVEYEFGKNNKKEAKIELGENKVLYINGVIDRLEKIDENKYAIIDYKTGKAEDTRGYSTKHKEDIEDYILNSGKNIQNVLYSMVAEQILDGDTEIIESSYHIFDSDSKQNPKIKTTNFDAGIEDACKNLLSKFYDNLNEGIFERKEKNCKYCEYEIVCEYEIKNNCLTNINDELLESINSFKGENDNE